MKKALILTDKAKEYLRSIHRYIAKESPQDAKLFVADLAAKIEWIAKVDFTGSPRDHIRPGLRGLPYRNRCIYFRSSPDRIVVVRVLHGAQDIESQDFAE